LVWIDHHKSSIEWAEGADFTCRGVRQIGKAACELAWEFFFGPDVPRAVRLLGRYDVWDHSDPTVLPFQYGMTVTDPAVCSPAWENIFYSSTALASILQKGVIAKTYAEKVNAEIVKTTAHTLEWEGLRWICLNGGYRGSRVFSGAVSAEPFDGTLAYHWNGRLWRFSLTSCAPNPKDVAAIAKKYGGGGHLTAAGFESDTLPFDVKDTKPLEG
jgi:oligoribonuclease NrnB/cAMP/cGMP phosphodiesterase (DHH superfamily)